MCERRQPAAGEVVRAATRNDGAAGDRGEPGPIAEATADGRGDPFGVWRGRRAARRALAPTCIGAAVPGAGRGVVAPAGGNRLARDGGERRRLPASDIGGWAGSRDAERPDRPCRGAEIRFSGCGWKPWKSVGSFGLSCGAGGAEFRSAGGRRSVAAEPPENP